MGFQGRSSRWNRNQWKAGPDVVCGSVRPGGQEQRGEQSSMQEQKEQKKERWDLYDRDKRPTGRTMIRNDWHMQPGEYHLTVLAEIVRPDGRILITQRIQTKAWAGGWWEIPGGGVQAGETSLQAVLREVREETGLDLADCPHRLAMTYRRDNPAEGDNYFVDIWRFEKDFRDSEIALQAEESVDFRAARPEEIRALADRGIFLHYDSIREIFAENGKISG